MILVHLIAGFSSIANLLGRPLGFLFEPGTANVMAAVIIANGAFLACLVLLYRIAEAELNVPAAKRALVYLTFFPTAFFFPADFFLVTVSQLLI